jgi:hypothetical protein
VPQRDEPIKSLFNADDSEGDLKEGAARLEAFLGKDTSHGKVFPAVTY